MVGPWLSGEKVNLRPLRRGDVDRRVAWLIDAETVKLFTGSEPVRAYERVDAERWRQTLEADLAAVVWAVETKQHQHIGDLDLHNIDRQAGLAKLTILIGDKAFWNGGCGKPLAAESAGAGRCSGRGVPQAGPAGFAIPCLQQPCPP